MRFLFGGITCRGQLLTLLSIIDRWRLEVPFMLKGLVQEKGTVDLRIIVMGL